MRLVMPLVVVLVVLDIGLDTILQECSLFDGWIRRIEALKVGSRT